MDPDANLREQIQIAKNIADDKFRCDKEIVFNAQRLAALVLGLDEWLSNSGFLPKEWKR